MSAEIKSKGKKTTFTTAVSLHAKFARHCKKLNVSVAQRLRDLMQADMKK